MTEQPPLAELVDAMPEGGAMDDIFAEPASHTAEKTLVARATDLAGVLVLKHDDTFLLTDARGDIELDHRGLGLYAGDTRFLSAVYIYSQTVSPDAVCLCGPLRPTLR